MGSVFPKPRDTGYICSLLQQIGKTASGVEGQDPDINQVADLIDDALADPGSRRIVLRALAAFISQSLAGAVPKPDKWQPPD